MTKIRKLKRSKRYRFSVNRKRLRNQQNKLPEIHCWTHTEMTVQQDVHTQMVNFDSPRQTYPGQTPGTRSSIYNGKQIKNAWKKGKSIATNLTQMGLACDPNKSLAIPSIKTALQPNDSEVSNCPPSAQSAEVANAIEMEAKLPRVNDFQLPASTVHSLTYFVKRYKDDYEAMTRDPKNFYQETASQLKAKIKKMKSTAKLTKINQSNG